MNAKCGDNEDEKIQIIETATKLIKSDIKAHQSKEK